VVVIGNVTAREVANKFQLNLGFIIMHNISVLGSAGCSVTDLEECLEWAAQSHLTPVVSEVLPLQQAQLAHSRVKQALGRVVLVPELNNKIKSKL
jgi:D-arabinose 1-dehydrogenase-like Zn-dependent alcohol dehydrogenase